MRLPPEPPLGGIVGMTEIVDRVKPHASRWYASAHWAFVLIEIAPGKTVVVAENKAAKRSMITDDFAWDTSGLGGNVGAAKLAG